MAFTGKGGKWRWAYGFANGFPAIAAARRIRPQTMTLCAALISLTPLLWVQGAGGSVMRRLAAPMIGGLATAFVLELLVLPALYFIAMQWVLRKEWGTSAAASQDVPAWQAGDGI